MAEDGKNKSLLTTYSVLAFYVILSSGQIFFNKWILSSDLFNFPFPVALTLLHMIFSSSLCFLLSSTFPIFRIQPGMTSTIFFRSIFPIGLSFSLTLWLGNSAYLYISVSFAQMLKAVMPVAVFVLGVMVGLETPTWRMLGIMCLISVGVVVASYGEVTFNLVGVVYQMGGVLAEAIRLILIEILLKRKGLTMDPFTMMYYVSPCSALCLLLPWLFLELPSMLTHSDMHIKPIIMSLNAMCTFALNISVFLVILFTSALTARVAGVVKDWIVVLASVVLFADTQLTYINVVGYAIAIFGVLLYNQYKLRIPSKSLDEKLDDGLDFDDVEKMNLKRGEEL